jgi:thiol-disulfide isomerase/thioredoxin
MFRQRATHKVEPTRMTRYRAALAAVAVLIVAAVLVTVIRMPAPPATASTTGGQVLPASQRIEAPDFVGIDGWLNSPPLTLADLRGKVVLIDFWTFSCVNCVRTIPHLQALYNDYKDDGFVIVGVHSPEFDFEMVPANVAAAVTRLGVTWPVAIDSQMATWNAYQNEYWPAEYLLDQQGRVAYTSFGEGDYTQTADAIAQLLGVKQAALPSSTPVPSNTTPELYVGSDSGRGELADSESYGAMGQPTDYPDPGPPQNDDLPQVTGTWTDEGQYLEADTTGHVRLHFQADSVYVVAGSNGPDLHVSVTLDGKSVGAANSGPALTSSGFTVSRQDLFQLLAGVSSGYHLIDLNVPAGFRIYTFTFG